MKKLLTTKEAAELLNMKPKTLETWRREGYGPPYVAIGRKVQYEIDDIKEWVKENKVINRSTSS